MHAHEKISRDQTLRQLLDDAVGSVGAVEGSILLLTEGGDGLRFALSYSPVSETLATLTQPLSKGITGLAVSLQQPMIVNETRQCPTYDPTVDTATGVRTDSIMVVPLVTSRQEFGALTAINSSKPSGFTSDDLELYLGYAERISKRLTDLDLGMENVGSLG